MKILIKIAVLALPFALINCAHPNHGGGHHHKSKGHSMKKWEKMDSNSDGKVTKAEFMTMHEEKFASMDSNKDGMVSTEEAMAHRKSKKKKCDRCK